MPTTKPPDKVHVIYVSKPMDFYDAKEFAEKEKQHGNYTPLLVCAPDSTSVAREVLLAEDDAFIASIDADKTDGPRSFPIHEWVDREDTLIA
jgi:hypothetical protein